MSAWGRDGALCRLHLLGKAAIVASFSQREQLPDGCRPLRAAVYVCKDNKDKVGDLLLGSSFQ